MLTCKHHHHFESILLNTENFVFCWWGSINIYQYYLVIKKYVSYFNVNLMLIISFYYHFRQMRIWGGVSLQCSGIVNTQIFFENYTFLFLLFKITIINWKARRIKFLTTLILL